MIDNLCLSETKACEALNYSFSGSAWSSLQPRSQGLFKSFRPILIALLKNETNEASKNRFKSFKSGIRIVVKLCRDPGDEVVVLNPIMTGDFEASQIWGAPPSIKSLRLELMTWNMVWIISVIKSFRKHTICTPSVLIFMNQSFQYNYIKKSKKKEISFNLVCSKN